MSLSEDHKAVRDQADHNGWHSVQDVCSKSDYGPKPIPTIFGEVDASSNSERNAHQTAHAKDQGRADDRVRHPTANLSHWLGCVRQESPIDGSRSLNNKVGKDRYQCPHHNSR